VVLTRRDYIFDLENISDTYTHKSELLNNINVENVLNTAAEIFDNFGPGLALKYSKKMPLKHRLMQFICRNKLFLGGFLGIVAIGIYLIRNKA
ncbi:MAG: hypothetical protein MHPSP_002874, partial [Paramarteilia canceri]